MKNVILLLLVTMLLYGCKERLSKGEVISVVTVNGETLYLEELLNSYGEEWYEMSKEEQKQIIDNWIDLTILYTNALRNETIRDDPALQFQVRNAEKKIYANALISNALNNIEIANDELFNYYRLRQSEFVEQTREFRVQRIFLRTEEEMTRVKRMLDNKDINFLDAAIRYSEEGIGKNGGYMNSLVTKAGSDSLLWEELNKKDKFYEALMPYRNGYLIARWYDFRTATSNSSFYDVRDEIDKILREEKITTIYEQVLRDARMNSNVVTEY